MDTIKLSWLALIIFAKTQMVEEPEWFLEGI